MVLGAGAGATGCGDDDPGRAGPPEFERREPFSPAKQQFIERADRVCTISMAAGARLPDEPRTPGQWYVAGRGTARLYRTAIRSILVLELPPPPDMAGARAFKRAARDILKAVRDIETETRALRAAIEDRDRGRAQRRIARLERALERSQVLDLRSTRIARDYGMDECGDDGSDPEAPEDLDLGPEL